jgi:TolB-like protein/DNA-binding winged helix-turn-helix (wHTH) protein/Tfp pilus assembly protein PilF
MEPENIYEFGRFRLDREARILFSGGKNIALTPKAVEVLLVLVEKRGELVAKDDLMKAVWPDTFVEESNLTTNISILRRQLGVHPDGGEYIQTIPKRGYRFVAAVDLPGQKPTGPDLARAEEPSLELTPTDVAPKSLLSARARGALGAVLTVAVVIGALVGFNIGGVRDRFLRKTRPARIESIAVLPFVNLSSEPENEYFSDGLTEEIIQSLAVVEGLAVISRTSSFALKGARLDIRDIGGKLNATLLLEGSVRKLGDQLRITAQLIRAADGQHLWSSTYDRQMQDVFGVQEEIAGSIANALRLKLAAVGQRHYTDNLEAYDLYIRGQHALQRNPEPTRTAPKIALQYFEQAIAKDANYALAYAGVADAFVAMAQRILLPQDEANARAKAAAEKALELDPMLSEAHAALALIRVQEYAWTEAEQGFRRAIELNPNNALAHEELGISVLVVQGRFDEGLGEIRRAVALDPLSPRTSTEFATALLIAGRYKEAENEARRSSVLDPTRPLSFDLLGRALYLQGRSTESLAAIQDADRRRTATAPGGRLGWPACAYVLAGQRDLGLRFLQKSLQGAYPPWPVPNTRLAEIYTCLGDKEHTFEYLEKMFAKHDAGLPTIILNPEFAWMRSDPRFAALRQKVGLAP